jgi:hypothetical protein
MSWCSASHKGIADDALATGRKLVAGSVAT